MKNRELFAIVFVLAMTGIATADSWTISGHYLSLNQAQPSGKTDNVGVAVSYDWWLSSNQTFAVEVIGSWDNPAELYGGGVNTKFHLAPWGKFDLYGGLYADYVHVRGLPSISQGGNGGSDDGWIYGPLFGFRVPCSQNLEYFVQYQYGWIDGGDLPGSFDEANWLVFGLEIKF
jgi:hypothetical protein